VVRKTALGEVDADLLAVGLYKDEASPEGLGGAAEPALSGGDFSGKAGQTALLYPGDALAASRLLLVGLGDRSSFTTEKLRRTAATVAKRARSFGANEATFLLPNPEGASVQGSAQAAAEGAALGLYRFTRYKTGGRAEPAEANAEDERELQGFDLVLGASVDEEAASSGAEAGAKVAAGSLLARDLANEPSNTATPRVLWGGRCWRARWQGPGRAGSPRRPSRRLQRLRRRPLRLRTRRGRGRSPVARARPLRSPRQAPPARRSCSG
jgi:leucyl aminopeptidase